MINEPNYIDRDELGVFCTLIESVKVTFNPTRTIKFNIIRPVDPYEAQLRYNKGTLTFKNVIHSNLKFINEQHEYPEFHRSAILDFSNLLTKTTKSKGVDKENYKDYFISIDQGNSMDEFHIICQTHELSLDNGDRQLSDFDGFKE